MNIETTVGSTTKIYFNTTPGASFPDAMVLKGSAVLGGASVTIVEIGNGLYVADYIPTSTGVHCVFAGGKVLARVEVVQKSSQAMLKNIEDECLGSWKWDKQSGLLEMIRQDGTLLASFEVTENLELASRERTA